MAHRVGATSVLTGTVGVAVGLAFSGLCTYAFLAIAARTLGPEPYAPFAGFWALLFVGGPGFFIPLEQEVGRALAARRVRGEGGRPVVMRAGVAGGVVVLVLVSGTALAAGPLTGRVFGGNAVLVPALMAGLAAFSYQFLVRGILGGNGRFGLYAILLAVEGLLRLIFSAVLAISGNGSVGSFALALVAASLLATSLTVMCQRGPTRPGPPASWYELSHAVGLLLIAGLMFEFLVSSGTATVQILATPGQHADASRFLSGRVIAFMPIYIFAAVGVPLLPRLSGFLVAGEHLQFRRTLSGLLALAGTIGLTTTVSVALIGPWVAGILFGSGFELGHLDFALLGASCGALMVTQVLGGSLVALKGFGRAAIGQSAGGLVFVVTVALVRPLLLRVELGLLFGALAAMITLSILLAFNVRARLGRSDDKLLGLT